MTAPRICRSCGAALPGAVRWFLQCYEPTRELTPRAAVWAPGEFVDNPIHTGGPIPHWSRWEKSPTTLGPWGRIALTVALLLTLPVAISMAMIMYVVWFPVIATVFLRGIWAKGWVVPGADDGQVRPARAPQRPDPYAEPPMTKGMIAWRAAWIGALLAGCMILAYTASHAAKAAVLSLATIVGMYAFWRGFFVR